MPIVATTDTRNSQWANDPSSYGRKMLAKMGWKGDGSGLGKTQQGTSTHLRAVRRAESLGIGAESDAFGEKGWQDTNAGFHGVLANLKREYSSSSVGGGGGGVGGSTSSGDGDSDGVDGQKAKKRRKKDGRCETTQKKKGRKDKKKKHDITSSDKGSGSDNGLRLPQNKVQAGHARKMREAKDIRNKSAEDMAAIFGVKADFYQKPREWTTEEVGLGNNNDGSDISGSSGVDGGRDSTASDAVEKKKNKKEKRKSQKKSKESDDSGTNNSDISESIRENNTKRDKKKRKRTKEDNEDCSSDREKTQKNKSKR